MHKVYGMHTGVHCKQIGYSYVVMPHYGYIMTYVSCSVSLDNFISEVFFHNTN